MNQATQEPVEVSLIDKLNWLLNERILAEQQVNLQGFSAILNASDRLREAHAKAFDLVPEILAALNTRAEVGGQPVAALAAEWNSLMDSTSMLTFDKAVLAWARKNVPTLLQAHPPAPTASPDVAALRKAFTDYVAEQDEAAWCNRVKYGTCVTKRCLVEAGWESGPIGGLHGTCARYRLDEALETLRAEKG